MRGAKKYAATGPRSEVIKERKTAKKRNDRWHAVVRSKNWSISKRKLFYT